ncbi:MAG: tetratricopeptide repeat protein, partial [Gammaproteobacteria bacterium]
RLSENPNEIQVLFLKGLTLANMDRLKEAESVFIDLTEDHPELPEPFNNLAVIYASSGEYDKAKEALISAINTHPSYAIAHENLGDIYAKMASQAYNQALKLDSDNKETRKKLAMINDLILEPKHVTKDQRLAALRPEAIAQIDTEPVVQKSEPEPELAKFDPRPTAILEPSFDSEAARKEVEIAVNSWASAWSSKDVDRYIKSYSVKFVPPKGLSRAKWQEQRHIRLNQPKYIKITLKDMTIKILGKNFAMARFTQTYQSDTYNDQVTKQLLLDNADGAAWLISREESN